MNTIYMNSEKSKTSDSHRLSLNLTDKIDLRRIDKYIILSNLTIFYPWKNVKKSYKNKISAVTWNEEFELPDQSSSLSDIQDYFEYILKKHGERTVNLSIQIYVNKIESRLKLKSKI